MWFCQVEHLQASTCQPSFTKLETACAIRPLMPVLQNSLLAMALCEQIFGSGSDADKQGPTEPALSVATTIWY